MLGRASDVGCIPLCVWCVDRFGGAQGCSACAVNLVNLWCALICSPSQSSFLQVHDPPFAHRRDDLTNVRTNHTHQVMAIGLGLSQVCLCLCS